MMLQQHDAGAKPPDSSLNAKVVNKQKAGSLPSSTAGAANGGGGGSGGAQETQEAQRCPRCDSLNTKFCYYNNYSLSQPRHFCKNCRRYWTKGGALRNVPVGGGCRKNKRLKYRDANSCLSVVQGEAANASASSAMLSAPLSSCSAMVGFGPSTSALIQDLTNDSQRQLIFSRFGMPIFDKRFIQVENEHQQHISHRQGGVPTQELFSSSPLLGGPFESTFIPAFSNYISKPESQNGSLLFSPQPLCHDSLTPFFNDHMNGATTSSMAAALDHFSSFTSGELSVPVSNNASSSSTSNGGVTVDSHLSLIPHSVQMNAIQPSHEVRSSEAEQGQDQAGGAISRPGLSEGNVDMCTAKTKGRSLISSLSIEFASQQIGCAHAEAAMLNAPGAPANESSLWNASWPEMHAALAGSSSVAGAMLH
ncbi:hypothetical protein KP509_35G046000 [Ceratopteris richardii]|uniref:Dof-type domain-containing protein n=1 Tax=Ceratopteris richardii TaxID=49495 RepID=A0A8T2QFS8_CERRI|nr:hypothetical protein KP509_35G046000 [Ceratopteris richardii]KAH7282749.1 hypothetical protein KP509_35G046000 [Ceratopteris richardii]